jgi:protein-S-isoprenylcysteine O-methyltransferase Ste14
MPYRGDVQKTIILERKRAERKVERLKRDHDIVCNILVLWLVFSPIAFIPYCSCSTVETTAELLGMAACMGFWLGLAGIYVYKWSVDRLSEAKCTVALLTSPPGTICVSDGSTNNNREA